MAEIGQIIYNVEAYDTTGGLLSTRYDGSISGTIDSTDPNYLTYRINIFDSTDKGLVSKIGAGATLSKLGIQAPPGTKCVINDDSKIIMVGRTGVYELDEDIVVTKLYFKRKKKYVIDQTATDEAKALGMSGLKIAENNRKAKISGGLVNYGTLTGATGQNIPSGVIYNIDANKFYLNGNEWSPEGGWQTGIYYIYLEETYFSYTVGIGSYTDTRAYWDSYREIQSEYSEAYNSAINYYLQGINGIYTLPNPEEPEAEENFQEVYNVIIDYVKS